MTEKAPTLSNADPKPTSSKFFKRFGLRGVDNLQVQQRINKLQQYTDTFAQFFAVNLPDPMRPAPDEVFNLVLQFASVGDWYVLDEGDRVGLVLIFDRAGQPNAAILAYDVDEHHIEMACSHAFKKLGYRKIKAEVRAPQAEVLANAGFKPVGVWTSDTLFDGVWTHIIALEVFNPAYEAEAGEAIEDGESLREHVRKHASNNIDADVQPRRDSWIQRIFRRN